MIDKFGRKVNYLRLSVTDRCDLRCNYCMPKKNSKLYPKSEILTLNDLKRITKILIEYFEVFVFLFLMFYLMRME